jgi:SAM-dependent methyltransferase
MMESPAGVPIQQIKQMMRASWMAGDFGQIAKTNTKMAEEFALGLPIEPGMRVLDVACGTGNTTIPLARKGAKMTGVDIAPNLLEQARARAAAENLDIRFDEGDAEQLPHDDASFDAVVSMFGAMFAPRPEVVAKELARVLRPGGLLAMANWNPASFTAQMFKVTTRHAPMPPGLPPPILWGDERELRQRLAPGWFADLRMEIVPMEFDLPTDPAGAVDFFRRYFGPTQATFARLDPEAQESLRDDLVALWAGANQSAEEGRTTVANQYMKVTARRQ